MSKTSKCQSLFCRSETFVNQTVFNRAIIMSVKVIEDDNQFHVELANAGAKLVIADFTATWCQPCQRIAPVFHELSQKFSNAVFIKIDVDKCQDTAAAQGVSAMPTFIFYRNKAKVDKLQGADPSSLESKIKQYYGEGKTGGEVVGGHLSYSVLCLKDDEDDEDVNEK